MTQSNQSNNSLTFDFTTLNLSDSPAKPHALRIAHESLCNDWLNGTEDWTLYDCNGGDIAQVFPLYPSDLSAAIEQNLKSFPFDLSWYPRLTHHLAGLPNRPPVPAIESILNSRRQHAYNLNLSHIDFLESLPIPSSKSIADAISTAPMALSGLTTTHSYLPPAMARLSLFLNKNLSQGTRKEQASFQSRACHLLARAGHSLTQWCIENDYAFAFRPPYAFKGTRYQELQAVHRIEDMMPPEFYTTLGANEVFDALTHALGFSPRWFAAPFGHMSGEAFRTQTLLGIRYWHNTTGNAVLAHRDGGHEMIVGPIGVENVLMHSPFDSDLYLYSDSPAGTFLVDDSIYSVVGFGHKGLNAGLPVELIKPSDSVKAASQVLALMAALLSCISASIATGRGRHKPFWTHTLPTTELIRMLDVRAPVIIHNLESLS